MYTLRTMLTNHTEHNQSLGKSYQLVLKRMAPAEFERLAVNYDTRPEGEIAGFIVAEGLDQFPIWSNLDHYIMTESGKTLSRLNENAQIKG